MKYDDLSFEKCIKKIKTPFKLPKKKYLVKGQFPVVSQEQKFISGYDNEPSHVFNVTKPVVIFGDHTQVLKYIDFDFVVGADGVKILLPNDNIDSKYFYYLLMSMMPKSKGYSRHYKLLKKLNIPIPSLAVQKLMVNKLDAIFIEIDRTRKNYKNIKMNLNMLKNKFIMSKLNQVKNFQNYLLNDICKKITDGSHNPPKVSKESSFMMLSSKNIFDDSINFDNPRFISKEDFINENKRTDVQKGDVLLTIVGTIGRCAVIKSDDFKFTLQRSVAVFKPNDLVEPRFLMYLLQSLILDFKKKSTGAAQQGIYLKKLKKINVRIPTIPEQKSIVKDIDNFSNKLDKLNKNFTLQDNNYISLKNSILSKEIKNELL